MSELEAMLKGKRLSEIFYPVKIFSKVLGEEIYIIPQESFKSMIEEDTIYYTHKEVKEMMGLPPEDMRALHEVKKHMGGEFEREEPRKKD